jgi:hypothetical protein
MVPARKSLTIRPTYVLVLFVTAPADIDDLAMLARFAKLAMARAEAASARAEALEAEGGDPAPHLAAMDRMGRAMRLALTLRRRFADETETHAVQRVQARKEQIRAALTPAICIQADTYERRCLQWELDQRLETEADTFADLPLETGLARLRQILGLPAFVHTDLGDTVPPPARSAVEGEVDRSEGPRRRGLKPTASAIGAPLTPDLIARARRIAATGPP